MSKSRNHNHSGDGGPTKAIIYCRVASTTEAATDLLLLSQEMRCRAYAADKGYPIEAIVTDRGVSGARFDRGGIRQLFQYLARDNAPGRYVVIVDDVARLARSVEAYSEIRQALQAAGAKLECRESGIGPELSPPSIMRSKTFERKRGPKR
jgi:DNA invertase Pin-like site-specific DNA recombinase